ncbi:MAG: NifU family protein [Syntrophales bacterium]
MKDKVKKAIDRIRPALQADGGNIEFVDVDEKGIVKVRLTGACHGCPMAQLTLKNVVEQTLKKEIPEVTSVVSV